MRSKYNIEELMQYKVPFENGEIKAKEIAEKENIRLDTLFWNC